MSPQEFWDRPHEEQAVMIAWSEARNEMSAYDDQIAQKNLETKTPKKV